MGRQCSERRHQHHSQSSEDTQGGYVATEFSNSENAGLVARYGGSLGRKSHYRLFVKGFDRQISDLSAGTDNWRCTRGGFRIDSRLTNRLDASVAGSAYANRGQYALSYSMLTAPYSGFSDRELRTDGADLVVNLNYQHRSYSTLNLMGYADHVEQNHPAISERRTTIGAELRHVWSPVSRHELVTGMEVRGTMDDLADGLVVSTREPSMSYWLYSAFAQDEVELVRSRLNLTLGAKVERSLGTDWEMQPNARLMFTPGRGHKLWCSAAQAIRTPSRLEYNGEILAAVIPPLSAYNPTTLPLKVVGASQGSFGSERLFATEAGYRIQPHHELAVDISGYYNDYQDIRGFQLGGMALDTLSEIDNFTFYNVYKNSSSAYSFGGELAVDWKPLNVWRLRCGYTYMNLTRVVPEATDPLNSQLPPNVDASDPRNQLWLSNSISLPHDIEVDIVGRYVDRLEGNPVSAYIVGDARVGWTLASGLEIYGAARNLFGGHHYEFEPALRLMAAGREVEPQVIVGATWSFEPIGH